MKIATLINNSLELSQHIEEDLNSEKTNNDEIVQRIEQYGINTFNNVLQEIKIYIDTKR